jgi:signal transduction histidine kinase
VLSFFQQTGRPILLAGVFLLSIFPACSQSPAQVDSLRQAVSKMKPDTTKVYQMLQLGLWLENESPAESKEVYQQAVSLSRQLKASRLEALSLTSQGIAFYLLGKWDSAIYVYRESYAIAEKNQDANRMGVNLVNIGNVYQRTSNFPEALRYYQQAEKYLSLQRQPVLIANMIDIFDRIGNIKASRAYGYKAMRLAAQLKDTLSWIDAHINLFSTAQDSLLSKGKFLLFRALPVALRAGATDKVISVYHNLAEYYYFRDQYDSALHFSLLSRAAMTKPFATSTNLAYSTGQLSNIYLRTGKLAEARKEALLAIGYAHQADLLYLEKEVNKTLAQAEEKLGNFPASIAAYKKYILLNDSTDKMRNAELTDQMEARYQNEKKQKEINELELLRVKNENQIRFRNYVIIIVSLVVILVVLVAFSGYRHFQQEKRWQQLQIAELEKDKQLMLADAIVKSQEEERKRMAKDLHDGLGSMLSGIKMSLSTMKGNAVMTQENVQVFERALNMLDNSIRELRRVAHNLMPETLIKFGLTAALKDFADFINQSNALKAIFQQVGQERRLESTIELSVYRLANELINNALRHAAATELIIQLHYETASITLTIQDNGRGFNMDEVNQTAGAGWSNIRSRVEYLKGSVDLATKHGEGTSVTIHIPLAVI